MPGQTLEGSQVSFSVLDYDAHTQKESYTSLEAIFLFCHAGNTKTYKVCQGLADDGHKQFSSAMPIYTLVLQTHTQEHPLNYTIKCIHCEMPE